MGEYVHCFSDYVNHILNRSPSKQCFTFSKTQRFPQPKNAHTPEKAHTNYPNDLHYNQSSPKQRDESPSSRRRPFLQPQEKFQVKTQLKKILQKISQKSRSREHQNSLYEGIDRRYGAATAGYQNSPRRKKIDRSKSPARATQMQISNSPIKNITASGYYPTGIEINPKGRYTVSNVRNVNSPLFERLASRDKAQAIFKPGHQSIGPGNYEFFSEFGKVEK